MLSRLTLHDRIMLAGALLLALGVFMPLASLPIVGSFNYMSRGRGDGSIVLLLALVIGGLVIFRFRLIAAVLGLAVAGLMATTFVTLLNLLHEMDVKAADLAKDNPFGVLAVAFARNSGMEWGWVLLFAGVAMIIVAGFTAPRGSNLLSSLAKSTEPSGENPGFDPDAIVRKYVDQTRDTAEINVRRSNERQAQFGRAKFRVNAATSSRSDEIPTWVFWGSLMVCGLLIVGAISAIVGRDASIAKKESSETKQPQTVPLSTKTAQIKEATGATKDASSFSNHLTVDSVRLSEASNDTIAIITVKVPAKLSSVKCAVIEGTHYLGVGSKVNAFPPAEDVYVTVPGTGHGSSVRAECSSE